VGFFANAKNIYNNFKTLSNPNASEALRFLSNPETRSAFQTSLANGEAAWLGMFDLNNSSGENINADTAMRVATAFACINAGSESVSMLPMHLYKKVGDQKIVATEHPAYKLLHCRPNPWMTAKQFWRLVTQQRYTHGNSYGIITKKRGVPIKINLCSEPDQMDIIDAGDMPVYRYKGVEYYGTDVLHFKGFSKDGKIGLSTVRYHAETIGALKKLRKFANRSLSEKPSMYGSSSKDSPMGETQKKAFKDYWKKEMTDYDLNNQIPVLYNGFELKTIGFSPVDAQYLDQTKATKEDIYGIFNVPPMLAQNYNAGQTYSNAEQQNLIWLTYGVTPIITDYEQEIDYKIFSNAEQETYFSKFNEKALLRTDAKSQAEWLEKLFKIGGYSIDEIRDYIDENPIGDKRHWVEGNNMVPADKIEELIASRQRPVVSATQKKELKSILNGHYDGVMDILNQ
jgi:HK97 family phage portal protein